MTAKFHKSKRAVQRLRASSGGAHSRASRLEQAAGVPQGKAGAGNGTRLAKTRVKLVKCRIHGFRSSGKCPLCLALKRQKEGGR